MSSSVRRRRGDSGSADRGRAFADRGRAFAGLSQGCVRYAGSGRAGREPRHAIEAKTWEGGGVGHEAHTNQVGSSSLRLARLASVAAAGGSAGPLTSGPARARLIRPQQRRSDASPRARFTVRPLGPLGLPVTSMSSRPSAAMITCQGEGGTGVAEARQRRSCGPGRRAYNGVGESCCRGVDHTPLSPSTELTFSASHRPRQLPLVSVNFKCPEAPRQDGFGASVTPERAYAIVG